MIFRLFFRKPYAGEFQIIKHFYLHSIAALLTISLFPFFAFAIRFFVSASQKTFCEYALISRQKNCNTVVSSLRCPHRSCTVKILTGFLRKYHYYGYASSPRVTATHFAKSSRSIPWLQCNFQHFFAFTQKRTGISWRTCLVAPHTLMSCMQKYSVVKVQVHSTRPANGTGQH